MHMRNHLNRTYLALAMLTVIAVLTMVEAQGGKTEKTVTSGRLSITIPKGWEQKRGELTFRTGKGTERARLISVSEEPVAKGVTPQKQAKLLERTVLSLEGMSKVSETSTRIDGKPAHAIEFRLAREGRAPLRGEHITVPLKNSVVTVFWYVHESDWQKGREEMERIVKTIRIK